jgi:hypothetical protein
MKLSDFETYKENPFEITGITTVPIITKGAVVQMVNTDGELELMQRLSIEGTRQKDVLGYKKVFNSSISDIKNFSTPALKVWCYIMEELPIRQDEVYVSLSECMSYTEYDSKTAIYKGICELISKGFIARKVGEPHIYFINTGKFFNGKRP